MHHQFSSSSFSIITLFFYYFSRFCPCHCTYLFFLLLFLFCSVNAICHLEIKHIHKKIFMMKEQVEFKGISGQIEFKEGQRNTFRLDVMKLKQNFFVKCGEWSQSTGLNITDYEVLFEGNVLNTTLVVVTILQVPYVMLHDSKNVTGNARFYGFCVDLLEKISKQIGFNYILDLVHDRKVKKEEKKTFSHRSAFFVPHCLFMYL